MKKTWIAVGICLAFVAPQVFAQAANFEGTSLTANLNSADSTAEALQGGLSRKGSDTDGNVSLQLQYNTAVTDLFVLGLGGTASLSDLNAGKLTASNQAKIKDAYSIYIAPGFTFSDSVLGYGKLAYLGASAQFLPGSSRSVNGYGLGLGVQVLFGKNWFGQAEIMNNQYNELSTGSETDKLKSNVFSLGAGYRF